MLGKLLVAVGEDNVIWGSDSIWYGPTQVSIDAFRAFQIPAEMRERHGYPELTPEIKAKLRANTDELIERGGFGSPTIFVDGDDMYFGNDRLPLVREALARSAE